MPFPVTDVHSFFIVSHKCYGTNMKTKMYGVSHCMNSERAIKRAAIRSRDVAGRATSRQVNATFDTHTTHIYMIYTYAGCNTYNGGITIREEILRERGSA